MSHSGREAVNEVVPCFVTYDAGRTRNCRLPWDDSPLDAGHALKACAAKPRRGQHFPGITAQGRQTGWSDGPELAGPWSGVADGVLLCSQAAGGDVAAGGGGVDGQGGGSVAALQRVA